MPRRAGKSPAERKVKTMPNIERAQMRKWHDLMYLAYEKAASETITYTNFKTASRLGAFAYEMAKVYFARIARENENHGGKNNE